MLATLLINIILVSLAVIFHYEILRLLSAAIPRLSLQHRLRVMVGVFGTICAHVAEVWLFGIAMFLMIANGSFGSLQGNFDGSLIDCVYFSFTAYTSLGFGDIEPHGPLRFLVGVEALAGLSLITWSASFVFIEMRKSWD